MLARRDAGFALFAAIWTAALIALIATGISRDTRTLVRSARVEIAAARADALAQGALHHLALVLWAQAAGLPEPLADGTAPIGPLPRDGTPRPWRLDGAEVRLAVQAQAGLIDLNTTDADVLARYLAAAGAPDTLTAAILARRRPATGRIVSWRLGARPFNEVGELGALVDADLYPRLAPGLTVEGRGRLPDPALAPDPVRRVLDPAAPRAGTADSPVLGLRAEVRLADGTRAGWAGLWVPGPTPRWLTRGPLTP